MYWVLPASALQFVSTVYENILWYFVIFKFSEVTGHSSEFSLKEKCKCRFVQVKCETLKMKLKCSFIFSEAHITSVHFLFYFHCMFYPWTYSLNYSLFILLDEAINVFNLFFLTFLTKDGSNHCCAIESSLCFCFLCQAHKLCQNIQSHVFY